MYTVQHLYLFVSCETFQICSNSMVKYGQSDLESLLKKSSGMLNSHCISWWFRYNIDHFLGDSVFIYGLNNKLCLYNHN